ncbi:hypothetical protein JYU07_00360 [Roseiflexus sp. AH-315-K22]|nr:hypothetical protein [Roseiflexus sp. AH-315-K22]
MAEGSGSSFKAKDLFGSGPHRFEVMPEGVFVVSNTDIEGMPTAGSTALGQVELEVHVVGRLVAASDAALWSLRDAITAELVYPTPAGTAGSLVDLNGRTWTGMKIIAFEPTGLTDRGRQVTLGYRAVFRKM